MRNPNHFHFTRFNFKQKVYIFIFLLSVLALLLSIITLSRFYPQNPIFFPNSLNQQPPNEEPAIHLIGVIIQKLGQQIKAPSDDSEIKTFLTDMLDLMQSLKRTVQSQQKRSFLQQSSVLMEIHPLSRTKQSHDSAASFFLTEEIRKYAGIKPNRLKKQNFMGANGTFMSIGHPCFSMKEELEEYMDYDVGDLCKDDWKHAQKLMVHGCDPLPRRRCFARSPKLYTKPLPLNESLWRLPDDKNVGWSGYRCKSFACLAANRTGKGFSKCSDCFNFTNSVPALRNQSWDFLMEEVLSIKTGEIRIGLDFSAGTGTFAARMKELDVTVISATMNLGAPFSETIALRGLLPLYLTINQRLPFFDNTLDIIHSSRFLDGWMDIIVLDFVLYDWDRVLRPGGLLWIDGFFCRKEDLGVYLDGFGTMKYRRHKWVVAPKLDRDGEEVFFSAVLEKPLRPF